jgi:precorrin-4/cobalt-precorrin-4 C11-methyltransferase
MSIVSFIGAGPGDPELLTLKAVARIRQAGLILYAGSLVPPEAFRPHTSLPEDKIINSAVLSLEETHGHIKAAIDRRENVARIHTGDPSLYGAINEQMTLLDADGIDYEVIPGISSAMAAAAALRIEYTSPGITQSVIFTRMAGKTPVPESERLADLASHQATMVIFLSAGKAKEVQTELLTHYPPETPVAIAYRVGWPEEACFRTTLDRLAALVEDKKITRQALIIVGKVVDRAALRDARSKLYDKTYVHGYRGSRHE